MSTLERQLIVRECYLGDERELHIFRARTIRMTKQPAQLSNAPSKLTSEYGKSSTRHTLTSSARNLCVDILILRILAIVKLTYACTALQRASSHHRLSSPRFRRFTPRS